MPEMFVKTGVLFEVKAAVHTYQRIFSGGLQPTVGDGFVFVFDRQLAHRTFVRSLRCRVRSTTEGLQRGGIQFLQTVMRKISLGLGRTSKRKTKTVLELVRPRLIQQG